MDTRSQRFEKSIFRKTRRFNFRKENFDQAQKCISTISVVQEVLYYLFCKSKKNEKIFFIHSWTKYFFFQSVGRHFFFWRKLVWIAKMLLPCLLDAARLPVPQCTTPCAPSWLQRKHLQRCLLRKHLSSLLFLSFVSAEISPTVQLRALCFTSDATVLGSAVDARALE